jgi:hypothetical protein
MPTTDETKDRDELLDDVLAMVKALSTPRQDEVEYVQDAMRRARQEALEYLRRKREAGS